MPLLDLAAAGPDQLAAKSAALAISALVCNHTANQDAVRSVLCNADYLSELTANLMTCNQLQHSCLALSACITQ